MLIVKKANNHFLIDASLDEIDTLYGGILFLNCKYCPKFKETPYTPKARCDDTSYCDGIREKFEAVLSEERIRDESQSDS